MSGTGTENGDRRWVGELLQGRGVNSTEVIVNELFIFFVLSPET